MSFTESNHDRRTEHGEVLTRPELSDALQHRLDAFEGHLIELSVYFPGGSIRLFGRVRVVENEFVSFDGANAHFPCDAMITRNGVDGSWCFNSARYGGERTR